MRSLLACLLAFPKVRLALCCTWHQGWRCRMLCYCITTLALLYAPSVVVMCLHGVFQVIGAVLGAEPSPRASHAWRRARAPTTPHTSH